VDHPAADQVADPVADQLIAGQNGITPGIAKAALGVDA
jgi:hypothetical protein